MIYGEYHHHHIPHQSFVDICIKIYPLLRSSETLNYQRAKPVIRFGKFNMLSSSSSLFSMRLCLSRRCWGQRNAIRTPQIKYIYISPLYLEITQIYGNTKYMYTETIERSYRTLTRHVFMFC